MKNFEGLAEKERMRSARLEAFLRRGEPPFDYERSLFYKERQITRQVLERRIIPPLHFEILPTEKCNNNCVWCKGGHRNFMVSENELTESSMLSLMDQLGDYGIGGIVRFSGMSGEPLMNKGTLPAVKRGVEKGLNIGIITNGILLSDSTHAYLPGIYYLNVSLDAGTSETFNRLKGHRDDTFERILGNIKSLANFKRQQGLEFKLGVGYMFHPQNYAEIIEATRRVKAAGVDLIQFKVPYSPEGTSFTPEDIEKIGDLLSQAEEYSDDNFKVYPMQDKVEREAELSGKLPHQDYPNCFAQALNGLVGADGNAYVCVHYHYNRGAVSGEPIGNIYNQTFQEIWEGTRRQDVLKRLNPQEHCQFCNRYDTRVNKFLNFLAEPDIRFNQYSSQFS